MEERIIFKIMRTEAHIVIDQTIFDNMPIFDLEIEIFGLKKFTAERDHIQIAIEENYWLFASHLSSNNSIQLHLLVLVLKLILFDQFSGENIFSQTCL